jgi:hypothetical protein
MQISIRGRGDGKTDAREMRAATDPSCDCPGRKRVADLQGQDGAATV